MVSLFDVYIISTYCSDGKILILILENLKKYLISNIKKKILEKINNQRKSNSFECLVSISNDLELIKNHLKNSIDFGKLKLTDIEINQIQNELSEINLTINTIIETLLDMISNMIVDDLANAKKNTCENLSVDSIMATLDDYFYDLDIWMMKKNLPLLIEKLHVKIIGSDLIIKISMPRNRFEEFIRLKLEDLNCIANK
jgi:hypothetical protein